MITRNFKLFLNAGKQIPLMINVSQYDHGEKWVFTLYDDNGQKYTPSTGAIVGIKADNKGIINTGTVNSAGQVEIMETQQMTAAAGKAVFELLIDGDTHGTANFIVLVEPKPGDQADMSTSDLSLLQQAINSIAIAGSGAPAVATLAADMTDEGKIYLYAGSEVGYTAGDWYYYNGASWVDGGKYGGTVDATLTQPGQAADAKKVGDEINDLKSQIGDLSELETEDKTDIVSAINEIAQGGGTGSGLTEEIKQALLQLADAVGYMGAVGNDCYNDLYDAFYPPIPAESISLNKNTINLGTIGATQQLIATVLPNNTTDTVEWTTSNSAIATVSDEGLVTSVDYGSAVITATAGSVSASCSVVVAQATVSSISATYTQSGTVYASTSLDSLKSDLVVTATWSDSSTSTVASSEYTLSGTLAEGTSTVTVSYGGQTTTFTVIVSSNYLFNWDFTESLTDSVSGRTVALYGGASKGTPTQDSTGLHFTNATQIAYLGEISTLNTTYEIDVASFSFAGDTGSHVRFLMNSNTNSSSSPVGSGALIYRSGYGWSAYGYKSSNTSQTGASYRTWSTTGWGDLYSDSTANMNFFSGKTVKLVFTVAHSMSLYVDDTLIYTMTDVYFNGDRMKYAFIGGLRTLTSSSGDQCYNMTITGIRVYANA